MKSSKIIPSWFSPLTKCFLGVMVTLLICLPIHKNKLIMNITKQKGLITELQCQLAFSNLGFTVSQPINEDSRYDFIVDIDNHLIRIQCKTCSVLEDGTGITFATRSSRSNTNENIQRQYTKDEIDYFYTYYNGNSYLVKVEETSSQKTLRFTNPHNNTNINWADDFLLETVLIREYNCNFQYNEINVISKQKYQCPICGNEVKNKGRICINCSHIKMRVEDRPSREQLKEEIRTIPFTRLGQKYGVSDKAITKWCIAENLPSKKKDIMAYSEEEWKEV